MYIHKLGPRESLYLRGEVCFDCGNAKEDDLKIYMGGGHQQFVVCKNCMSAVQVIVEDYISYLIDVFGLTLQEALHSIKIQYNINSKIKERWDLR
jgi:hypothetical protein